MVIVHSYVELPEGNLKFPKFPEASAKELPPNQAGKPYPTERCDQTRLTHDLNLALHPLGQNDTEITGDIRSSLGHGPMLLMMAIR